MLQLNHNIDKNEMLLLYFYKLTSVSYIQAIYVRHFLIRNSTLLDIITTIWQTHSLLPISIWYLQKQNKTKQQQQQQQQNKFTQQGIENNFVQTA